MNQRGRLRVVHVTEDMARITGGVPAVVHQLSERLSRNGIPVQIAHATGDPDQLPSGVEVFSFPPAGLGKLWSWGYGLRSGLAKLAAPSNGDAPVFHVHGTWSAPQYFAARVAHRINVPFVFTAHGMLEPWLWNHQGWRIRSKKRAYWSAFAYPALSKASVVHAITSLEKEHLTRLFPKNRIEVIPNTVDLNDFNDSNLGSRTVERLILFIGRLDEKKGVDILLKAFATANLDSSWSLAIIGPIWSIRFKNKLEKIVSENGIANRVSFLGPVFGEKKREWLRKSWVLAAPSHSEVVGLVNLEAAALHVPSITTHQTGLSDWEMGGGLLIQPDADQMRNALLQACAWSDSEREERGTASRRLVSERYSWDAVLPRWVSLYESLI